MRVVVATTAGAGHFRPLVPFARALVAAGHEVVVAAPASFAATVEGAGFEHRPFADADPAALGAVFARLPSLSYDDANAVVVGEVFGRLDVVAALPGVRALVDEWRPDVILRESSELASYAVAEEAGIPHVHVVIALLSVGERFSPVLEQPLADVGVARGLAGMRAAPQLTLLPPSFDPVPAGTAAPDRFRDAAAAGDAGPLPDWWAGSADPLVYVSFGSVAASLGLFPDFYRGVVDALADLPVRSLLTLGRGPDPADLGPLPPSVHVEPWFPQEAVMPHAAAMVGHGGLGTTLAGLAGGVPQVVLPLFADQLYNAERVAAIGAGTALPMGPEGLGGLTAAVRDLLADGSARAGAQRAAAEIAALPAVEAAVPRLEGIAGGAA